MRCCELCCVQMSHDHGHRSAAGHHHRRPSMLRIMTAMVTTIAIATHGPRSSFRVTKVCWGSVLCRPYILRRLCAFAGNIKLYRAKTQRSNVRELFCGDRIVTVKSGAERVPGEAGAFHPGGKFSNAGKDT